MKQMNGTMAPRTGSTRSEALIACPDQGRRIFEIRIAASNITTNTSPVVRPRYCPPSSSTTDAGEGEGGAVVVDVGDGEGSGLVGSGVGSVDGSGVGEGEVCAGLTPVTALTLYFAEDETGSPERDAGNAVGERAEEKGKEFIHDRPQFRNRASMMTTAAGTSERTTPRATPGAGACTEFVADID